MYRLLSQGYESFTGEIGNVSFENGTVNTSLTVRQIYAIGSNYYLEKELEDGTKFQLSPTSVDPNAIVFINELIAQENGDAEVVVDLIKLDIKSDTDTVKEASRKSFKYTRAYLEAIADKSGMAGLRELAPEDIKAKSVKALINGLLTLTTPV